MAAVRVMHGSHVLHSARFCLIDAIITDPPRRVASPGAYPPATSLLYAVHSGCLEFPLVIPMENLLA